MSEYTKPPSEHEPVDDFEKGQRVAYLPQHVWDNGKPNMQHPDVERGTVSSVSDLYVFVRFDKHVSKFGWEGATSQACLPPDLLIEASPTDPIKQGIFG